MHVTMCSSTLPLILCLLLVTELTRALDCSSNSQDPTYEPFPQNVTPPQLHTRMEISLSHRNATYFVDERFDAEKQRGAFTLIGDEYDWESYWDKSENEIDNLYARVHQDQDLEECWSYNW